SPRPPDRTLLLPASLPPPPPLSTLFPYTTLFRSAHPGRTHRTPRPEPRKSRRRGQQGPGSRSPAARTGVAVHPELIAQRPFQVEDRKSTRLNSSHVAISYAVFCLKKKKQNIALTA